MARVTIFRASGTWLVDMYVSTRLTTSDPWGAPVSLDALNIPDKCEYFGSASEDCSTLYFSRGDFFYLGELPNAPALGTYDIWQVEVAPILYLNNDGTVGRLDVYELVNHWGRTDNSLCDIAPLPLGDGIVDAKDLVVLAEHLKEHAEPVDSRPLSRWRLDMPRYGVAYDSIGHSDGIVHGDPIWQSGEGQASGALVFDGTDDYIETPFVLDPASGSFSVFAWISGGALGRVIVSQSGSSDFLMVGMQGNLVTAVAGGGRRASDLLASEKMVVDGIWHHVGLVMTGSHRQLYVDGEKVAEDDMSEVQSSDSGLYIGAGQGLGPDSFAVGRIKDVCVYNQALKQDEIAELAN